MDVKLVRSWRALAWRGIAGLFFGLAAFFWPRLAFAELVVLFGAYAMIDGTFAIAAGTRQLGEEHAWMLGLEGLVGVSVGFTAFLWTGIGVAPFVYLVSFWGVATGALELLSAVHLRRQLPGEMLLAGAGVASFALAVVLFVWPREDVISMVRVLGFYALLFGITMLLLAMRLRRMTHHEPPRDLHAGHHAR